LPSKPKRTRERGCPEQRGSTEAGEAVSSATVIIPSAAAYRRLGAFTGQMADSRNTGLDGTPVTVVTSDKNGRPVTVHGVCRPQFSMLETEFRCFTTNKNGPDNLYVWENEGITWIRGHHEPDSKEAQALLVAYALWRSAT
jgi:hypothetical protein